MDEVGGAPTRVAVVGAGFIAGIHLEVLERLDNVIVVGVCDLDRDRAEALARRWDVPGIYTSLEALIAEARPDVAHILVPPPQHAGVARSLLEHGVSVLLEKPMTLSSSEARDLIALARRQGVRLGINHNNVFHPLFQRLLADVERRRIGGVEHVGMLMSMPLRQLDAGDYSHWMFREPHNIVFEQMPHPFSQALTLLGPARRVHTVCPSRRELIRGMLTFHDSWLFTLECERGTAQISFAPGKSFPESWVHVLGQDGSIRVDLLHNTYTLNERTRWLDFFDTFLSIGHNARRLAGASVRGVADYGLSLLRLQERSDTFYRGMKGSLRDFHDAYRSGRAPFCAGEHGLMVIDACEKATRTLRHGSSVRLEVPAEPDAPRSQDRVLVIGATGFIGGRLVRRLVEKGCHVRAMVRRPEFAGDELRHPLVRVEPGDITDERAVARAVDHVDTVFHLATGDGRSWESLQRTMIGGLEKVANACLDARVRRLVFTSTIAVYDLGGRQTVTEQTPLDPDPESRGLYARAKIECERLLERLHRERGLAAVIVRPAIVVGEGGIAQHSGVGLWNRDGQCIGWGLGKNPLPFVLVDDVACAMAAMMELGGDGLQAFNLAGDVRLNAREYVAELARVTGRPIKFHPRSLWLSQLMEIGKWLVKKAAGRKDAPFPSYRDLRSRSCRAPFDCRRARDLPAWKPVASRQLFVEQALACHVLPRCAVTTPDDVAQEGSGACARVPGECGVAGPERGE